MVNWKAIAITFIILFILQILFVGWLWSIGTEAIEKETECSVNVCSGYDAFYYDEWDSICYCYIDNEIEKEEYMK